MKPIKDTKKLLFENMAKLNPNFKLNEEIIQERLTTYASEIHSKLKQVPELKRLNLWSTASSIVGLYRYEPDGYAYEIEIRPVEIGRYKDLWGNQIKKREDREANVNEFYRKPYSTYGKANDPRVITLQYDGICAETGKVLKAGEQAVYYPSSKQVFCMDSNQAKEFRDWKADMDAGYDY